MVKACFLDRDGTLNKDTMYPHKLGDFELLPGVIEGLRKLKDDFIFVIITNQSGIGRGIHTEEDMHNFNDMLVKELNNNNIEIKKIYHCPHTPDDLCECRKPSDKYIMDAKKEFNIDLKSSWAVGDHPHDVEMGIKAGCKTVYLLTGHGKKHKGDLKAKKIKPDFIAKDFLQAAEFIIKHNNKNANTDNK